MLLIFSPAVLSMQLRIPGTVVVRGADGSAPDDFQLPPGDLLHDVRDAAFESQLLLLIMLISAR